MAQLLLHHGADWRLTNARGIRSHGQHFNLPRYPLPLEHLLNRKVCNKVTFPLLARPHRTRVGGGRDGMGGGPARLARCRVPIDVTDPCVAQFCWRLAICGGLKGVYAGCAFFISGAMGSSEEVAELLRLLDEQGRTPTGFRRMPLLSLHRLALAGRAELRPLAVGGGGPEAAEAARVRSVLSFLFPGPAAGLSLPAELLPRFVRVIGTA